MLSDLEYLHVRVHPNVQVRYFGPHRRCPTSCRFRYALAAPKNDCFRVYEQPT